MKSSFEMDQLREVLSGVTENGQRPVTNALLFEAFKMGNGMEREKSQLRRRLNHLVKRGELVRLEPGKYTFLPTPKTRNGEMFQRIWRAVRSSKPGFSVGDIAQVTRADYTTVMKYFKALEAEGYLARHGQQGNTRYYRATIKAKEQRETYYPPLEIKNPFEKECGAACRIVRALMERDPYQPAVKQKIVDAVWILVERFDPEMTGAKN